MTNKSYFYSNQKTNSRKARDRDRFKKDSILFLRFVLVVSFTVGVFWLITLPRWVITSNKQIEIEGNNLLTEDEIRSLIPLDYPQSLMQLSTQDLARQIESKIPVKNIVITKEFLPPLVRISLEEKQPIALALGSKISEKNKQPTIQPIGYIDKNGIFISYSLYQKLRTDKKQLPLLKIVGLPQIYLPYWSEFYHLITQSSIKINMVDWQNPNNLILDTEIGKVYLGAYGTKFPQQLTVLQKLKPLTGKIPRSKILYIDLTDPEMPSIKEKK